LKTPYPGIPREEAKITNTGTETERTLAGTPFFRLSGPQIPSKYEYPCTLISGIPRKGAENGSKWLEMPSKMGIYTSFFDLSSTLLMANFYSPKWGEKPIPFYPPPDPTRILTFPKLDPKKGLF